MEILIAKIVWKHDVRLQSGVFSLNFEGFFSVSTSIDITVYTAKMFYIFFYNIAQKYSSVASRMI